MKPPIVFKIAEVRRERKVSDADPGAVLVSDGGESMRVSSLYMERHNPKAGMYFVRYENGDLDCVREIQ